MKKILLFTIIISFFWSCKKNDNAPPDRLPNITTTGANTFGCMINGELWIPRIDDSITGNFDEIEADYYSPIQEILIIGRKITNNEEIDQQLNLFKSFISEDTFSLYSFSGGSAADIIDFNCGDYHVDTSEFSQLIISKLDLENEIISGTFEFTAIREDEDCELEKMEVTDGRFDLKLRIF